MFTTPSGDLVFGAAVAVVPKPIPVPGGKAARTRAVQRLPCGLRRRGRLSNSRARHFDKHDMVFGEVENQFR